MKTLEDVFKLNGFDYQLVERGETYFIYSKRRRNHETFEVFQRRITPPARYERAGQLVDLDTAESFPRDEAFGKWAWAHGTLDAARARASKITRHASLDKHTDLVTTEPVLEDAV